MLNTKLNELKRMLMEQASLVEKMVIISMNAIQSGYECNLESVMRYEDRVNRIELEIETYCTSLIALYQPEAKDLRAILMSYKINNDLERLADQAVNITESANAICGEPISEQFPQLLDMKLKSIAMLHKSMSAFINKDVALARQVCADDNEVDELNNSIRKNLVILMKKSPEFINNYLHLLRITNNLERIADLSTNIAENTVFLVEGKVIKHHVDDEQ
jgi:phosphate transport system protein